MEAHQHDDSCYTEELVCGIPESDGHHHTEACYEVSRVLVCGKTDHQHGKSCYDADGKLICGIEEHTHDDDCYKEKRELVCGLKESEGHRHTEDCYRKVLTCGKETHTHSTECYKDNAAATVMMEGAAVASDESSEITEMDFGEEESSELETFGATENEEAFEAGENGTAGGDASAFAEEDQFPGEGDRYSGEEDQFSEEEDQILEEDGEITDSATEEDAYSAADDAADDKADEDRENESSEAPETNFSTDGEDGESGFAAETEPAIDGEDGESGSGSADADHSIDGEEESESGTAEEGLPTEEDGEDGSGETDLAIGEDGEDGSGETDLAIGEAGEDGSGETDLATGEDGEDGSGETDLATGEDGEDVSGEAADASGTGAADAETGDESVLREAGDQTGADSADTSAAAESETADSAETAAESEIASTAGTEDTSADPSAAAKEGYVPVLDQLNFARILNKKTAIYYSHAADQTDGSADNQTDGSEDGAEAALFDTAAQDGQEAELSLSEGTAPDPAADWKKVNKDTELAPADLLRVYLAYTIPAGELNETNAVARYRLPSGLHLTDDQIRSINTTVNGIAAQYVDYDKLEILDVEAYNKYLGIEAVEGTRRPSDDIREYLEKNDQEEYISATVKAENVYNEISGELEGQDLIFTFATYTVMKNRHEYDAEGKPVKAGEKVRGWVCLDLTTDQVDWETSQITTEEIEGEVTPEGTGQEEAQEPTEEAADSETQEDAAALETEKTEEVTADAEKPEADTEAEAETSDTAAGKTVTIRQVEEKTAEIVFVEEDRELGIDEISSKLKMILVQDLVSEEAPASDSEEAAENAGTKDKETSDEKAAEDKAAVENTEDHRAGENAGNVNPADYPAATFDDRITVTAGSLNSDTETGSSPEKVTELKVHVEADEGTFPVGTTMRLAEADPDIVAAALEGSVEGRTKGFHAVDISFWSVPGDGSSTEPVEIEPLKPIRVSITSEAIRQAVEDSSTAPLVVHVEDSADKSDKENKADKSDADDKADESDEADEADKADKAVKTQDLTETKDAETEGNADTLTFEADSFSVYAVVYTVDFHYEVNGKMYEFSIPGGGFASFYKIVEVLGISNQGTQNEFVGENAENEGENATENSKIEVGNGKNTDGNDVYNEVEESGVEDTGIYSDAISLNNVEVSDATRQFLADVASVEFSNSELVWVGKVEDATTVGGLKEANGLEVQYSAELTEEQIAEINGTIVESGDWALISTRPFDTEESLTVTMKNGDQFLVKVTDGQEATEVADIDTDGFYVIYVDRFYNNTHHFYALRNDGASVAVPNNNLDALGNEFTWRFGYDGTACWWYNGSNYIEPEWSMVVGDNPGGRYLWIEKRGSGFGIHGNYWSDNYLSWDSSNGFKIVNNGFDVAIKIYEKDKPQLNFSVAVNNPSYGSVSCSNTVTDLEWKNTVPIVATPAEGCYFVGWRRGEEVLTGYDSTIPVGGIEFTQDNQILTAVFAKNYTSPATQEINEWVDSLLGNPLVSDKTAHVVDYDNRIYEVDLTASSSRYTIDQDIRIEFITDISRSMYFPETLLNEQDFTVNGQINLGQWLLDNGDPEEVYYVIGDINNTATMYAVYFSGNDYFTRWSIIDASYYLPYDNASTSGRIKNVCQISNGNTTVSITDRFADNRIFTGKIYNSTPKPPKDTADWDRLSYLTAAVKAVSRAIYRLDPGAEIGLVTFASAASGGTLYGADDEASLISEINSIQPVGGTNQTSAFNLINNSNPPVFTTNSGKRQVALLITDGAPQGTTWDAIERAAGTTEGNGVEIWTLGLALDRVGNNKSRLMNLASEGGYSGNAEDADQLVTETKTILEEMLVKATVIGEVYDTVDPAFYPVDASGDPIKEGYYYADTTGGSITRHSAVPADVKKAYYHWVNNNGTWSVAYYNQEIKWPENGGWKESFFIKAKEDFMGGNTISTNSGVDNRVEANRVKHSGSPEGYYWINQDHSSFRVDYETPYVNVDELSLTENSTEWTVYLGTEVDPAKELRQLWDKIRVNQVVKSNGLDDEIIAVTQGSQMYYSDDLLNDASTPDGTSNETLPFSHFINADLIETLLRQIENDETTASSNLIYRYFPYGHSIIGRFELSLEKTVNSAAAEDGAPEKHETKEKGEEREAYTLKVTYIPVNDGASETYTHTTQGKSAGKVADGYDGTTGNKLDSENTHKIHVYAKNLEIQKKDMGNNQLIDTAKFKLYRTAKSKTDEVTGNVTYESGTSDLKVGNETKKVVQIGDEMTTSGGKITVEDLSYAPNGVYYLVETKAPDGYIMVAEPIEMHLYLDDAYTHYLPPKDSVTEAFTEDNPYNWTQSVNRFVYNSSKTGEVDDTTITIEVLNNPGVELPSTGGPGTNLIYFLGIMLTGLAGAGLVMKRRRRSAA